jgi:hypothetical protein
VIDRNESRRPPKAAGATALGVVRTTSDAEWMAVLSQSTKHDFHHLPGYHRVAEYRGEGTAFLFTYREGEYLIALPLLLRPIDEDEPAGLQDATSVYGYAGPIASHERIPLLAIRNFQESLRNELQDRHVVSVFSRLHPLIAQGELLFGLGETRAIGQTVSVDLSLPLDDQWAGYGKKCRRIIQKAREAGMICIHDQERSYQHEWVDIYRETMKRVSAPGSYLFDDEYFEVLAHELGEALNLFVAIIDGSVAAAGLYTLCDGIVQAHLGGMRSEYMKLSPTRLLDDTARLWGHASGARVFHLGGGVGGREDSLFQYKTGFSDRRHQFRTWRWIVEPEIYRELCARRHRSDEQQGVTAGAGDFFPAYRRAADPEDHSDRRSRRVAPTPT